MKKLFLAIAMLSISCAVFAQDVGLPEVAPSTLAIVFGCLFAISEVLASIPKLKANSIFQLIKMVLAAIVNGVKTS